MHRLCKYSHYRVIKILKCLRLPDDGAQAGYILNIQLVPAARALIEKPCAIAGYRKIKVLNRHRSEFLYKCLFIKLTSSFSVTSVQEYHSTSFLTGCDATLPCTIIQ